MNYIDRLKKCQLPTLDYRRIRGDMIETYKIVSGKYDSMATPMIPGSHSCTLQEDTISDYIKVGQSMICEDTFSLTE